MLHLHEITHGEGQFVTVGSMGVIVTSPDGTNWTTSSPGNGQTLSGVAYGEGSYVAVGDGGTIVTAGEAMVWKSRNSGTGLDLFSVAYGNHTFVVVGNGGAVLQSISTRLPLRFTSLRTSQAALQLRLIDERGQAFRVQASTNLADWTELPAVTRQQQGLWVLELPRPIAPQSFYRAVVP
jgi:hypothetical protein